MSKWQWGVADNAEKPHCWVEHPTGARLIIPGVTAADSLLAMRTCAKLNRTGGSHELAVAHVYAHAYTAERERCNTQDAREHAAHAAKAFAALLT